MNTKTIIIDSSQRTSGVANNFIINEPGNQKVFTSRPKSVKLLSSIISYSWYNVQTGSNVFNFTGAISGAHNLIVPSNNYTGTTLATQLQTLINIATNPIVYSVTFDNTTQKFTFTSTENFSIDFTVADNMHVLLGFSEIITPLAVTVTSDLVAGFTINKYIYICSSLINGIDNGYIPFGINSPTNKHILFALPITGCFGSLITSSNLLGEFFTITNSSYSETGVDTPREMQFWLEFPDGSPVLLNGQDWSCVLMFDFNNPSGI